MNIFITSTCPYTCAAALDDLRLNKMILETAQLLSVGISVGLGKPAPYRNSHANHPCAVWTRANRFNYSWLIEHFDGLFEERRNRSAFDIDHASYTLRPIFVANADEFPDTPFTTPPNCTDFKQLSLFDAYKAALSAKWDAHHPKTPPTWRNTAPPNWYKGVYSYA